jgi:hypothetical protein
VHDDPVRHAAWPTIARHEDVNHLGGESPQVQRAEAAENSVLTGGQYRRPPPLRRPDWTTVHKEHRPMHPLPSAASQEVPDGLGRQVLLGLRDADDPVLNLEDRVHLSRVPKPVRTGAACG